MMLALATTPLLPYHPTDYARRLNDTYQQLIADHGETLQDNDVDTGEKYKCVCVWSCTSS